MNLVLVIIYVKIVHLGYYVDGELRGINLGIKELGGKEPYYQRFGFHVISNLDIDSTTKVVIAAPLYQQAFRWFREKYKSKFILSEDYYWIVGIGQTKVKSYEEAELECLKKLIEIAKEKK